MQISVCEEESCIKLFKCLFDASSVTPEECVEECNVHSFNEQQC